MNSSKLFIINWIQIKWIYTCMRLVHLKWVILEGERKWAHFGRRKEVGSYTQNPGSSAYTQHRVLYTWDQLIMSISQVGKPLHELEEDLSRSYLIWTLNLLKLNFESTFPEYVWGVWGTRVFQENVSIVCEYSDTTQMLFKRLIINANLCVTPRLKILLAVWIKTESIRIHCKIGTLMETLDFVFW